MKTEDKAYFEALLEGFETEFWKTLIKHEFEPTLDQALRSAINCADEKELYQRKGNVQTLTWLTNLEVVVRANYEAALADEEDEVEDDADL